MKNLKYIFSYSGVSKIEIIINIFKLFLYKLIGKRFVVKQIHNNKMILDLVAPGISTTLFIYGKRELLETNIIINEIEEDMNVLDIGANIGYYAILEASLLNNGLVYAFEPDLRNVEILKRNIKLNNFSNKIKLYPYAVAERNCYKKFYLSQETNLSSFLKSNKNVNSISIKCIKLDDLEEINKINFIRMDIEGYECKVIDGMKNRLKNGNSLKLMIEVHPYVYNNEDFDFKKRLKFLDSCNFHIKYLISASTAKPKQIISRYKPIKVIKEGRFDRGLYRNIELNEMFKFLDSKIKIVRAIFLEKK